MLFLCKLYVMLWSLCRDWIDVDTSLGPMNKLRDEHVKIFNKQKVVFGLFPV